MVSFAARTHPGRRAGDNEDSIGSDPERSLWFVADGMGGHAAGAVASQVVKDTLLKLAGTMPLDDAVLRAHEAVAADAARVAAHAGMGSTLVAAQLSGGRATIVWVGDSRAYLWRRNRLRQLTRDHSLMEELRTRGGLSEAELRQHPNRHMVTRTLGLGSPVPSRYDASLRTGDWILLCSDGLNDELTDEAMANILRTSRTPDEAGDALIAAALDHGGNDNVSAVIVAYDEAVKGRRSIELSARTVIILSVVVGVAAALAVAAVWALFHG
jgi:serine/threonine protein phosphatase PrpC